MFRATVVCSNPRSYTSLTIQFPSQLSYRYYNKQNRRQHLSRQERYRRSLRNFRHLPGANLLYSKVDLQTEDDSLDLSFGLLQKGKDTRLITVDPETGDLKKLPWEHEHDTYEAPLELRALYKEIDSERAREEVEAKRIASTIDYQIYDHVLRERIYAVEDAFEELNLPPSWELTDRINATIDEVIDETNEEFYQYYKERDERLFAFIEEHLHNITAHGAPDTHNLRQLFEARVKIEKQDEIAALSALSQIRLKPRPDDDEIEDDEEVPVSDDLEQALSLVAPDDDSIHPDREPLLAEQAELAQQGIPDLQNMPEMVTISNNRKQRSNQTSDSNFKPKFKYLGADANFDPGNVYQDYEKMKLYLKEPIDDAFSGLDRVLAHLKARDRQKKIEGKEAHRNYWQSGEAMSDYIDFLENDPEAKRALEADRNLQRDMASQLKIENLKDPRTEDASILSATRNYGQSGEEKDYLKILDHLKKLPKHYR